MKTTTINKDNLNSSWHLINAEGKVLGRLASEIAVLLTGKNKPNYSDTLNTGDKVVVINSSQLKVTGKKLDDKTYYRHTGYPGGLRSTTLSELNEKKPTEALRRAVKGMLPKNKLQKVRIKNLYIYTDSEHPHKGQIDNQ